MNSLIQHGDALCEEPIRELARNVLEQPIDRPVGTLGLIMASDNTYVALTAGHIIGEGSNNMIIRRENGEAVVLQVAKMSIRHGGRPAGRLGLRPGFRDDCGFLRVNREDIKKFDHSITCVNPHYFTVPDRSEPDAGNPVDQSRRNFLDAILDSGSIVVYKQGASTDLTMGRMTEISGTAPFGWYTEDSGSEEADASYIQFEQDDDSNDDSNSDSDDGDDDADGDGDDSGDGADHSDSDDSGSGDGADRGDGDDSGSGDDDDDDEEDLDEWMGVVEWYENIPFAQAGDSGSLVFAKEGNITIPLGIHVGSPGSAPNRSYFISLETFCYEAEKEGWELRLTERE